LRVSSGDSEVDGFDLDQGEVFLAFMGGRTLPLMESPGLQIELANLRGRDINVVGAGQVVVVGGAKEAVAVGEDFKNTLGEDVAFFFALRLENLEDQILFAKAAGAWEFPGYARCG